MKTCENSLDTDQASVSVLNISAYKFVHLEDLPNLRKQLKSLADDHQLKGTILLASEGINLFVAGNASLVRKFLDSLQADPRFSNLPIKESWSDSQPFNRMLVRLKKEIISFGVDTIDPENRPSKKISAAQLKQWLDEGREILLLDTRNDYEVELGTFDSAVDLKIHSFREFPQRVLDLPAETRDKPMVMFCTGGIRCEKAGPYVEQAGFKDVYQLDGGILRYFEECGGSHYHGDCFVFDDRVAVKPDLAPSGAVLCYRCQHVLTADDIASPKYKAAHSCPYCFQSSEVQKQNAIAARQAIIDKLKDDLPGSHTYTNVRPIHIPRRLAGRTLLQCLVEMFPQFDESYWQAEAAAGLLRLPVWMPRHDPIVAGQLAAEGHIASLEKVMSEGERVNHLELHCVEPDVNSNIRILDEDEVLIIVDKPAGLPSHASGRYNRNTLEQFMNLAYAPEKVRLTHRLDANTSGILVLARRFSAAKKLQEQFTAGQVSKTYLARVHGLPQEDRFQCDASISRECGPGGVRTVDSQDGQSALTEFEVIKRFEDGTTLLKVWPKTGRTNQIRCHLWHLGFPIVNDPAYLPDGKLGMNRTLSPDEPAMCLHAAEISIMHPLRSERCKWTSAAPAWA